VIGARLVRRLDAACYPGESPTWDNQRYRAHLLRHLCPGDRVLDLGAGRGRVPEMDLRAAVAHVTGADPDPCVVENPHLHEAVVLDDPRAPLPFPDRAFDAVVTANVLEHVDDPVAMFAEVRRVLRPGGLFVSKTPNRTHYVAAIAALTPHAFHTWVNQRRGRAAADTYPTHYLANSRRAVRELARRTGFDVVGLATWEGPPNYLRIVPPLYPVGIAYERVVNATERLADLRAVLVTTLRRSA
jgi:SAM-dependent methyltransferase